jgi:hypothetical protein
LGVKNFKIILFIYLVGYWFQINATEIELNAPNGAKPYSIIINETDKNGIYSYDEKGNKILTIQGEFQRHPEKGYALEWLNSGFINQTYETIVLTQVGDVILIRRNGSPITLLDHSEIVTSKFDIRKITVLIPETTKKYSHESINEYIFISIEKENTPFTGFIPISRSTDRNIIKGSFIILENKAYNYKELSLRLYNPNDYINYIGAPKDQLYYIFPNKSLLIPSCDSIDTETISLCNSAEEIFKRNGSNETKIIQELFSKYKEFFYRALNLDTLSLESPVPYKTENLKDTLELSSFNTTYANIEYRQYLDNINSGFYTESGQSGRLIKKGILSSNFYSLNKDFTRIGFFNNSPVIFYLNQNGKFKIQALPVSLLDEDMEIEEESRGTKRSSYERWDSIEEYYEKEEITNKKTRPILKDSAILEVGSLRKKTDDDITKTEHAFVVSLNYDKDRYDQTNVYHLIVDSDGYFEIDKTIPLAKKFYDEEDIKRRISTQSSTKGNIVLFDTETPKSTNIDEYKNLYDPTNYHKDLLDGKKILPLDKNPIHINNEKSKIIYQKFPSNSSGKERSGLYKIMPNTGRLEVLSYGKLRNDLGIKLPFGIDNEMYEFVVIEEENPESKTRSGTLNIFGAGPNDEVLEIGEYKSEDLSKVTTDQIKIDTIPEKNIVLIQRGHTFYNNMLNGPRENGLVVITPKQNEISAPQDNLTHTFNPILNLKKIMNVNDRNFYFIPSFEIKSVVDSSNIFKVNILFPYAPPHASAYEHNIGISYEHLMDISNPSLLTDPDFITVEPIADTNVFRINSKLKGLNGIIINNTGSTTIKVDGSTIIDKLTHQIGNGYYQIVTANTDASKLALIPTIYLTSKRNSEKNNTTNSVVIHEASFSSIEEIEATGLKFEEELDLNGYFSLTANLMYPDAQIFDTIQKRYLGLYYFEGNLTSKAYNAGVRRRDLDFVLELKNTKKKFIAFVKDQNSLKDQFNCDVIFFMYDLSDAKKGLHVHLNSALMPTMSAIKNKLRTPTIHTEYIENGKKSVSIFSLPGGKNLLAMRFFYNDHNNDVFLGGDILQTFSVPSQQEVLGLTINEIKNRLIQDTKTRNVLWRLPKSAANDPESYALIDTTSDVKGVFNQAKIITEQTNKKSKFKYGSNFFGFDYAYNESYNPWKLTWTREIDHLVGDPKYKLDLFKEQLRIIKEVAESGQLPNQARKIIFKVPEALYDFFVNYVVTQYYLRNPKLGKLKAPYETKEKNNTNEELIELYRYTTPYNFTQSYIIDNLKKMVDNGNGVLLVTNEDLLDESNSTHLRPDGPFNLSFNLDQKNDTAAINTKEPNPTLGNVKPHPMYFFDTDGNEISNPNSINRNIPVILFMPDDPEKFKELQNALKGEQAYGFVSFWDTKIHEDEKVPPNVWEIYQIEDPATDDLMRFVIEYFKRPEFARYKIEYKNMASLLIGSVRELAKREKKSPFEGILSTLSTLSQLAIDDFIKLLKKEITETEINTALGKEFNLPLSLDTLPPDDWHHKLIPDTQQYKEAMRKWNKLYSGRTTLKKTIAEVFLRITHFPSESYPIPSSILLPGNSGTGKTTLLETFKEAFGVGDNLLRIDLNDLRKPNIKWEEYFEDHIAQWLVKHPAGGILFLDELDKPSSEMIGEILGWFRSMAEGKGKNEPIGGKYVNLKNFKWNPARTHIVYAMNYTNAITKHEKAGAKDPSTATKEQQIMAALGMSENSYLKRIPYIIPIDSGSDVYLEAIGLRQREFQLKVLTDSKIVGVPSHNLIRYFYNNATKTKEGSVRELVGTMTDKELLPKILNYQYKLTSAEKQKFPFVILNASENKINIIDKKDPGFIDLLSSILKENLRAKTVAGIASNVEDSFPNLEAGNYQPVDLLTFASLRDHLKEETNLTKYNQLTTLEFIAGDMNTPISKNLRDKNGKVISKETIQLARRYRLIRTELNKFLNLILFNRIDTPYKTSLKKEKEPVAKSVVNDLMAQEPKKFVKARNWAIRENLGNFIDVIFDDLSEMARLVSFENKNYVNPYVMRRLRLDLLELALANVKYDEFAHYLLALVDELSKTPANAINEVVYNTLFGDGSVITIDVLPETVSKMLDNLGSTEDIKSIKQENLFKETCAKMLETL